MKKWLGKIILMIVIATVTSFLVMRAMEPPQQAPAVITAKAEGVFDRVMRTRTIKCGYFALAPYINKDPNTGKLTGLWVDFMDALGAITDLKVEWTSELNFGTYLEDLESGRYDMECAGGWPNGKRGQFVYYSQPYAYMPLVAVVREGDHRFDNDPDTINKPEIKLSTMDGETTSVLRHLRFSASQDVSLPPTSSLNDLMLNVTTGKADVTFTDILTASKFRDANPGTVRLINYNPPLYLVTMSPSLPPDIRLKEMVDVATNQLLNSGKIEEILRKYETEPGQFLRIAPPYKN